MVALVSGATFASTSVNPQWKVWQYSPKTGNGPYHSKAAGPHGSTASFAFDALDDQALLTSNATAYAPMGNLLGTTVTATFSIAAPTGTTFSAYTDPTQGCNSPTAVVRFYFSTKLVLGAVTPFQAGLYADQLWWSNSVSIPLATVFASTTGTTLTVTFAAANWSNVVGTPGAGDANFSIAAANVDQVGLSFGSPDCYAFGDGSSPAGALFNLTAFSIN